VAVSFPGLPAPLRLARILLRNPPVTKHLFPAGIAGVALCLGGCAVTAVPGEHTGWYKHHRD